MVTKICRIIADFFIKEKIISEDQRDVCEYGFELCITALIGLLLIIFLGIVFGKIVEAVTFYIVSCFTRLFCGGFHAKSHLHCKITLIFTFWLIVLIDWLITGISDYFWFIIYLYSFIIVCTFAPVENPNKRLTNKEKKRSKIISITEMVIWFAVILIMRNFRCSLYHIVALTLFFVATYMLLGKHCKGGKKDEKSQKSCS